MNLFDIVETIAIKECKQNNPNSYENEITSKLFNYISYVYPFKQVQTND